MSKNKRTHRRPARFQAPFGLASPGRAQQLAALLEQARVLMLQGQPEQVVELLEPGLSRFGNHPPYRAALAAAYGQLGLFQEAAQHAHLAADLAPQVAEYRFLAAIAWYEAGYYTLAHRARQSWQHLAPSDAVIASEFEWQELSYQAGLDDLCNRYGVDDRALAERAGYGLDMARWALSQERWGDAVSHARQVIKLLPQWPPPRNNLSLALYYIGEPAAAIAEAEAVLREIDPNNVQALSNLVRFCLARGDTAAAQGYGERLAALPLPMEVDTATKLVEGLALLDRDEDVLRVIKQMAKQFGELSGQLHLDWAIAAANLGRRREALAHAREAEARGDDSPLAVETIIALRARRPGRGIAERYSYTHVSDWITHDLLNRFLLLIRREAEHGQRDERRWAELLARCPQIVLVAQKMLYEDMAGTGAPGAEMHLRLLQVIGTPGALEVLRTFALGRVGMQEDRMLALNLLKQAGGLPADATVMMWVDGEQHPIESTGYDIVSDDLTSYSPEALLAYEQARTAHRAGDIAAAERGYRRAIALFPNAKEAYNNLGAILVQRGETAEGEECLDRALAIDPLYAFPRVTRALQALYAGDLTTAKEWLEPLRSVTHWPASGFINYQKGLARIAIYEERFLEAQGHLQMAQNLAPEDTEIEELLEDIDSAVLDEKIAHGMRRRDQEYRQGRQATPLPADPTLADCLAIMTRGDLLGISAMLNLPSSSKLRKDELRQNLLTYLDNPDFVAGVVATLSTRERAALRDVLAQGGTMGWSAFAAAYDHDMEERPYLEYHARSRKTIMGRLRARGLLFEGTAAGQLIIAIPRELRPHLEESILDFGF